MEVLLDNIRALMSSLNELTGGNDIDSLDTSLIRPGRIDICLKLDYLVEETFFKMLCKFKVSYTTKQVDMFSIRENLSPADLQKDLLQGLNSYDLIAKHIKV